MSLCHTRIFKVIDTPISTSLLKRDTLDLSNPIDC